VRRLVLAVCVLFAGCASSLVPVRVEAPEGYAISFPGMAETVTGRDGPVDYRIDAMRTPDDARFEAAWFRFPQALDGAERGQLLQRIERGLVGPGARVTSRVETPPGNKDRVDLILDHADGRRGYHRVIYTSPKTMLQVSAVGPKGGEWELVAERFLGSLHLRQEAPLDDVPISASLR
jgi:hypothetical protein